MGWAGTIHGYPPVVFFNQEMRVFISLGAKLENLRLLFIEIVNPVLDARGLSDFTRPPLKRYAGLVTFNPIDAL
jgi:hypothetical protein